MAGPCEAMLSFYKNSMSIFFSSVEYIPENELQQFHLQTKSQTMQQIQEFLVKHLVENKNWKIYLISKFIFEQLRKIEPEISSIW